MDDDLFISFFGKSEKQQEFLDSGLISKNEFTEFFEDNISRANYEFSSDTFGSIYTERVNLEIIDDL